MKTTTKKCLSLCLIAFAMVCFSFASVAQVIVSQWNGYTSGNPPADGEFLATAGSTANNNTAVLTREVTGIVYVVNTDGVAASPTWDAGANTKYWIATFSTNGYDNLSLVSKQKGSNKGPKDFKIQYRVGDGAWTDVPGGTVVVANDAYISGVVETNLPAAMSNKPSVALRWLCSSDASIDETEIQTGGINRLDVVVKGAGEVALTADFDATPRTGAPGTVVQFTDKSTGTPIAWQWTISGADNFSSTQQNPSFTFTKTGSYNVKLVVSDENTSDVKEIANFININNFVFYQDWNDQQWNGWTKKSIGSGVQEWSIIDKYGIDNSPCVRMSGHDGSNSVTNEDWLISPKFKLTSGNHAKFNFQNAVSTHPGPVLELYISTNYDGNDVTAANWTKLSFTSSPSEQSYVWTNSGDISLSTFSGENCYIGFKYISTEDASSVWELDNISLSNDAVSIADIAPKLECKIYPNPSNGIFTVEAPDAVKVQVYSIDGRLVKEQIIDNNGKIDIATYPQGIYLLKMTTESGAKTTRKIIVQ